MSEVKQESKSGALLVWVLTLFFSFLPGLIFMIIKKEDSFILENSKTALNWCITLIISLIACMILGTILVKIIGALGMVVFLLYLALCVANLIFCIMGAINANKGIAYKPPFYLKLVK